MSSTKDEAEQLNFSIAAVDKTQGRMFCGPTVLAMLTGKPRSEIHADVNKLLRKRGKKKYKATYYRDGSFKTWAKKPWPLTAMVRGMHDHQLERLLDKYDLAPKWRKEKYASLRRFFEDVGHFKMPIVVNVTGHFILYFQGKVYDTLRPLGEELLTHPCAGRKVKSYWLINKQS